MSFSCSRDQLPGNTQSNFAKAFEAFRSAISFRRSILGHGNNHDRKDAEDVKNPYGEIRNV